MHCGTIAIVGRPNVGKSTLLNQLVGERVSITSSKPQTTRHRIAGILTTPEAQFIFVDTPGFQQKHLSQLNRIMNRTVTTSLEAVDVVLAVVDATRFGDADKAVVDLIPPGTPTVLAINKVDCLPDKAALLPLIARASSIRDFRATVPVSAEGKGYQIGVLKRELARLLPEQPPIYPPDQITDRDERFMAAEYVREKLFRLLGDEIPYGLTVAIDQFKLSKGVRHIDATVFVDKAGHRPIVLGRDGEVMKRVGTEARRDMERMFGSRVVLHVWVRVRSGWSDNAAQLRRFGFE